MKVIKVERYIWQTHWIYVETYLIVVTENSLKSIVFKKFKLAHFIKK